MLAAMTAEEFEERWAHYWIQPWGDDWQIGSTIAASVQNAITRYIAARAGKPLEKHQMISDEAFIPRPKWARRKRRPVSAEESERQLTRL